MNANINCQSILTYNKHGLSQHIVIVHHNHLTIYENGNLERPHSLSAFRLLVLFPITCTPLCSVNQKKREVNSMPVKW